MENVFGLCCLCGLLDGYNVVDCWEDVDDEVVEEEVGEDEDEEEEDLVFSFKLNIECSVYIFVNFV